MQPLEEFPAQVAQNLVAVLTDIDDTLTFQGQLPARAYAALEALSEAGIPVVPITGRPAGWCDLIARLWPVAGVVGENGAFYFAYEREAKRMRRRFMATELERSSNRTRLHELGQRILGAVPGAALSSDQPYRESDLAIDFCEDVPALPRAAVQRILALFAEAGATAKVSSIHVNGWFGDFDKLSMTEIFLREVLGLKLEEVREKVVFCGDSPNDAPMFGYFPHACGVANVRDFPLELSALPAYVSSERGGAGFVQIAERILSLRGESHRF